ncbi:MAG: hypothetical protein LBP87_03285 [Planctomycetaceae bacterium]|jgi:hypothetical protein|nr:hypothetical protein [Planctomycetaceae bacterium]
MANWYYFDQTGKKCGPVDSGTLKILAAHGIITPATTILTEDGKGSLAEKVRGLEFPQTFHVSTSAPPPLPTHSVPVPPMQNVTPPQMENTLSRLAGNRNVTTKVKSQTSYDVEDISGEFPIVIFVYTYMIFNFGYLGAARLEIYKNKITVRNIGLYNFLLHGLKGVKTLHYSKISALQVLRASYWFFNGYIQFTISGGNESRGGIFSAARDENTVMFSFRHNDIVQAIHDFIETRMDNEDSADALRVLQEQSLNHTILPFDGCLALLLLGGIFIAGFILFFTMLL